MSQDKCSLDSDEVGGMYGVPEPSYCPFCGSEAIVDTDMNGYATCSKSGRGFWIEL